MNNSDITKEKTLLEFLKEYMLLAEIAYIESNAPVSISLGNFSIHDDSYL